jgi:hypothetical protein
MRCKSTSAAFSGSTLATPWRPHVQQGQAIPTGQINIGSPILDEDCNFKLKHLLNCHVQ